MYMYTASVQQVWRDGDDDIWMDGDGDGDGDAVAFAKTLDSDSNPPRLL